MDQNLKWAKEPDLYWLQAPLLKEPKNSPLVHYPVYYHRKYDVYQTQPSPVISMPQVVDADYCYVRALVENLFERLVNLVAELSSLI